MDLRAVSIAAMKVSFAIGITSNFASLGAEASQRVRSEFESQLMAQGRSGAALVRPLECYDSVMAHPNILRCTKDKFTDKRVDTVAERRLMRLCQYSDGIGAVTCLAKAESSDRILSAAKSGLALPFNCKHDDLAARLCGDSRVHHIATDGSGHVLATACAEFLDRQTRLDEGSRDLLLPTEVHDFFGRLNQSGRDDQFVFACRTSSPPRQGKPSFDLCARQAVERQRQQPGHKSTLGIAKAVILQCRGTR